MYINYLNFSKQVLPLSILCVKLFTSVLCQLRHSSNIYASCDKLDKSVKISKLFWRRVKIKKQHEILRLAQVCKQFVDDIDCNVCLIEN